MLPIEFTERMKSLLGNESQAFFDALEKEDAVKAFRVNLAKLSVADFEAMVSKFDKDPMGFPNYGYYTREQYPGSMPCHHGGMIYMQDPSAMATVTAVDIRKGMKILDCCAAPGGKSTQLAALTGDEGLVVANEYEGKRAKILQGNAERLGCRNMVVLNLDTAVLAGLYPAYFDLVVVDAPCSGEGMFRKNSMAISEWSLENVSMCAERQKEILRNAVACLASGGLLLYSTCTFSLEENEMNVRWLLEEYPMLSLCDVTEGLKNNSADGICLENCLIDMTKTRRFYPHKSKGEGQFIALLRHTGTHQEENALSSQPKEKKARRGEQKKQSKEETEAILLAKSFLKENLTAELPTEGHTLALKGQYVYLAPRLPLPERGTVMAGVCVGEVTRGRLIPHHQLFSAYGKLFKRQVNLDIHSKEASAYLCGLEIAVDAPTCSEGSNGWAAVLLNGVPLGGGKISNGICKNHYPKGLRN